MFRYLDDYAWTLFHELAHSTGHPARLGRFTRVSGAPRVEEVIASLASVLLLAVAGIDDEEIRRARAEEMRERLGRIGAYPQIEVAGSSHGSPEPRTIAAPEILLEYLPAAVQAARRVLGEVGNEPAVPIPARKVETRPSRWNRLFERLRRTVQQEGRHA
jgi:antirestriction protein ArdC